MDTQPNAIEFDERNRDELNIPPVLACTGRFASASDYAKHCLEQHSVAGRLPIGCPRCFEQFSEVAAFADHCSRQPLQGYLCRLCNYVAEFGNSRKKNLLYHFRNVHPNVFLQIAVLPRRPSQSKIAQMTENQRCLKLEQADDSSFPTSGLGAVSPKFSDRKDGAVNTCPDCTKTFPDREGVRHHRLKVHCKKLYSCKFCSRKFRYLVQVGRHSSDVHLAELKKSTLGPNLKIGSRREKTVPMQICITKPGLDNSKQIEGINRRQFIGNGLAIPSTSGATKNDKIVSSPVSTNCEAKDLSSRVQLKRDATVEVIKREVVPSTACQANEDIEVFSRSRSKTIVISGAALEKTTQEDEEEDTKPDVEFMLSWDSADIKQSGQTGPQTGLFCDAYKDMQGVDNEVKYVEMAGNPSEDIKDVKIEEDGSQSEERISIA